MEQVSDPNVVGTPVWTVKSLAFVVTADVCLVVARHWRCYDMLGKSLAVLLLAYLVMIPAVATWGRNWRGYARMGTRRIEWSGLTPTYILLMLATLLFGMR